MKFFFTKLVVSMSVFTLLFSCSKSDSTLLDEVPNKVSNLSAEAKNEKILLTWENPVDNDLDKIVISYNGITKDIVKTENSFLAEDLINDKEYAFNLYAIDIGGNKSPIVSINSIPKGFVSSYNGTEYSSGTYFIDKGSYTQQIIINGTDYKNSFTNSQGVKFIRDGKLIKNENGTFTYDYEYYGIRDGKKDHRAFIVDITNMVLSFEYNKRIRLASVVYEKIEGDAKFLTGKYKTFKNTSSVDQLNANENVEYLLEYKANGEVIETSYGNETKDTWTNQDILNENVIFVIYNSKTYLIKSPEDYIIKQ